MKPAAPRAAPARTRCPPPAARRAGAARPRQHAEGGDPAGAGPGPAGAGRSSCRRSAGWELGHGVSHPEGRGASSMPGPGSPPSVPAFGSPPSGSPLGVPQWTTAIPDRQRRTHDHARPDRRHPRQDRARDRRQFRHRPERLRSPGAARRGSSWSAGTQKTEAAAGTVRAGAPDATVEVEIRDLGSLQAIRDLGHRLRERLDHLDALNNAGRCTARQDLLDGFEMTYAVNHLGYFLPTELLPLLQAAPAARIVNVASNAHRAGTIDFDDLQMDRRGYSAGPPTAPPLMNILFTRERPAASRARPSPPTACIPASCGRIRPERPGLAEHRVGDDVGVPHLPGVRCRDERLPLCRPVGRRRDGPLLREVQGEDPAQESDAGRRREAPVGGECRAGRGVGGGVARFPRRDCWVAVRQTPHSARRAPPHSPPRPCCMLAPS